MKVAFWRRKTVPQVPHDFKKDQPQLSTTGEARQPPKLAKDEKGKIAAHINYVDIALDGYDDIFSDFDQSPFSSRILSKDLVDEVMRRHRETKEGEIEVRFSVPERLRKRDDEALIRTRLKEYFHAQAEKVEEDLHRRKKWGIILLVSGLVLVTLHRFFSEFLGDGLGHKIYKWFENPMELFGWIATWVGADRLFLHKPEELIERKAAFERFGRANFIFVSAESVKKGIERAGERPEKKEGKQAKPAEAAVPLGPLPESVPSSDGKGGGSPE